MSNITKVRTYDLDRILFYTFRYALGRSTYAVDDVSKILEKYKDCLHINTKRKIIHEINESINDNDAGMKCDIGAWRGLIEILEKDK